MIFGKIIYRVTSRHELPIDEGSVLSCRGKSYLERHIVEMLKEDDRHATRDYMGKA
jgi:hypothetical protein